MRFRFSANRFLRLAMIISLVSSFGAGLAHGEPKAHREPTGWCRSPIDTFVEAKRQSSGRAPNPPAGPRTLVRRVSLDLTGLPPTPAEVDAYLDDHRPDAYERLVDRLLASPRFGERMAQFWLDLARYADSDGYHDDAERSMWQYRDWVIDAFNHAKPFDQFTTEQLAGDLLPNATLDQMIATAFLRNGPTTTEDGANPAEYRARYAVDRVNTVSTIWLGLTVQCAECHDHKYDPISTREYYQLFAFFNQTPEVPLFRGIHAPPTIPVPSRDDLRQQQRLRQKLDQLNKRRATVDFVDAFDAWKRRSQHTTPTPRQNNEVVCELLFQGDDLAAKLRNTGSRRRAASIISAADGVSPNWVPGLLDQAMHFSGRGERLTLGQVIEFRRTVPFTLEAWLKHEANGGTIISKMCNDATQQGFEFSVDNGRYTVRLVQDWPEVAIQVSTLVRFPINQWQHVSVTYDGSSRAEGVHIYVNGEAQDLNIDRRTEALRRIQNSSPLSIAAGHEERPGFQGAIEEIRFYKWPLPNEELAQLPLHAFPRSGTVSPTEAVAIATERDAPLNFDPLSLFPSIASADPDDDEEPRSFLPDETRKTTNIDHQWSPLQSRFLRRYFRDYIHPDTVPLRKQIEELQRELEEFTVARLRVMQAIPDRRPTHVLMRGDFRAPGDAVRPNTPSMLAPMPALQDVADDYSRLDLARWLTENNATHTAQVIANRTWAQIFGQGIVTTLDDFGAQGENPTHPRLLTHLANELIHHQWDLKSIIRQTVTSATYRQSSSFLTRDDPDVANRYLSRSSRRRLSAEAIRDVALRAGGLLSDPIGGPSVFPYQPPGLWREMAKGDEDQKSYTPSHGEDLYRRGIYTFWKRSIHHPAFSILDAPSREVCTSSRPVTNTPAGALVLLNDPTFVEAARAFAVRIIHHSSKTNERLQFAFRHAVSRTPTPSEQTTLENLCNRIADQYDAHPSDARQLGQVGEWEQPDRFTAQELATWTAVAQVILTMDETITKE